MKRLFALFLIVFVCSIGGNVFGQAKTPTTTKEICADAPCDKGGSFFGMVDSLLNYSSNFLGIHYVWGGKSPKGFDCSGFVSYVFQKFNILTPVRALDYTHYGEKIAKADAKPGDVICFKRSTSSSQIGHVGIVTKVENGVITFINAASSKGISFSTLDNTYWSARYMGIRRIF